MLVAGAWAMAGAAASTALALLGSGVGVEASLLPLGLGGVFGGMLAGLMAHAVERRSAQRRPGLTDGKGRTARPLHGWLFALPIAVAVPSLVVLAVVGSVAMASPVPALGFGGAGLGVLWGGRRVWSRQRLASALVAAEHGSATEGLAALQAVADSRWMLRSAGAQARLALGTMALQSGELERAERYLLAVGPTGSAGALASTSLALVYVLQGRLEDGHARLAGALAGGHARRVARTQADAVRLLLVWRKEGADAGRELGERLLGSGPGSLFLGLLGALRRDAGDLRGAREALDGGAASALRESGLANVVTELAFLADW